LAGSYLKQLQLAKQLEEKTKEAQKNRDLAEKENSALDVFLESCKESDVDLTSVEKLKRDFEASMASKDYQAALAHVRKARDEAKTAYMHKIGEVGDSVEALLTLIQGSGSESKSARELLEKSKERALSDDLESAMKFAREAFNAAERTLHETFSQLFSQAQETVMEAKEVGDDVTIFEDGLSRAKAALEAQEYESCMTQIKEVLEGVGEDLKSQINTVISRVEELMSAGTELGVEMSRLKGHSEKATASLAAMKFKESLSYARKAEAEGESAISTRFQERARELRETVKKMKSAKEDASVPQQFLDQAQSALKDKKYIEALHALNTAYERVHKAEFESVLEVITQARDRFVLAKKVGVDMTKAIVLLNTSRDNLKLGKFEDAISYAEQSRKEIDTALEEFYKARDHVVELAKAVKFAADMGVDTTVVKKTLAEARKNFESQDYERTAEATKRGINDVKKLTYDRAMEAVNAADRVVKLGKEIGADVTEAEGTLQRAMENLGKENMVETVNLAKSSKEAADSAMTRVMSDKLQSIDQFVKGYTGVGGLEEVGETITQARQRVASFEFEQAQGLIKQVTHRIETIGQVECDKLIALAISKIDSVRSMEGDVSDLEVLLTRANESLSKKVYEDATARAREIVQNADDMMNKLIQMEFSSVKDSLEEAKTIGIDIEDAKDLLKEARIKTENQDFSSAFSIIRNAKTTLQAQITRYDRVKGKVRRAEELISEAGRAKTNVAAVVSKLDTARNAFSIGQLDEAERLLDEATAETEKNLGMYLAAKFILSSKENIDLAETHGMDVEPVVKLLARAKDMMKSKSYDEALAIAKQCDQDTKTIIASNIAEMIKNLQRLLTDARNVGVDTLGPEKLSEKAAGLARAEDYAEALRCISSAREDINQVKNLSSQAALEIRVARNNLKDAETLDIDVEKARELLEQAIEALTRRQYAIALELARKSSETSSEVSKTRIWETLKKFSDKIEESASEGMHLGTAESCVADGIRSFKEGRYQDALKLAMKCEIEMERAELQKDISTRAVELARRKLNESTAEETRSEHVSNLVEKAESLLRQGKYVDAMTAAIESGDELHLVAENLDSSRIELSAARERIGRLKKIGINTSECDDILDMAQEFLSSHEFAKSRDAVRRAAAMETSLFEDSLKDVMDQNRQMIAKAKAMGINTKPCEDLLEVANTSYQEKLWDYAHQQAMACREDCLKLISKKLSNLVEEVQDKIETLSRFGASVKPIEEMVNVARAAETQGDIAKAFQTLMEADLKVSGLEDVHKKYIDISIAAESAMENLGRYGLSKREPERLIAMAEIEKDKDYDSAVELVAEALDTAKELMEAYSPDISGSVSGIGLQEGAKSELTVTLKNVGRALAKDVTLDVQGDFDVMTAEGVASLKPNAEATMIVNLVPRRSGSVPVKIRITSRRQLDGRMQVSEIEDFVNVFSAGPPFKLGRAADSARCISCQGRIKPGFDIVTCRCGGQLHLSCAKRTNQCPICGQKYEF
jgi:tetratricopeptide (TPR) repeat protein/molybdopterin synthase catalytic subunit